MHAEVTELIGRVAAAEAARRGAQSAAEEHLRTIAGQRDDICDKDVAVSKLNKELEREATRCSVATTEAVAKGKEIATLHAEVAELIDRVTAAEVARQGAQSAAEEHLRTIAGQGDDIHAMRGTLDEAISETARAREEAARPPAPVAERGVQTDGASSASGIAFAAPGALPTAGTGTAHEPMLVAERSQMTKSLWDWQRRLPSSASVFRAYELERDLFFVLSGLRQRQLVAEERFCSLWDEAMATETRDLLAEIVARQDLRLECLASALMLAGDFGARALLYYARLERQVRQQRREERTYAGRRTVLM